MVTVLEEHIACISGEETFFLEDGGNMFSGMLH
jgi:hypothetical protein